MKVKVIKTKKEYDTACARLYKLMHKKLKKGDPELEELELLSMVLEAYEEEKYPIPPPDPIEAIKFRIDQMGVPPSTLHRLLGSRQRSSDILNRRRKLTLPMMRRLHKELKIPMETLVGTD